MSGLEREDLDAVRGALIELSERLNGQDAARMRLEANLERVRAELAEHLALPSEDVALAMIEKHAGAQPTEVRLDYLEGELRKVAAQAARAEESVTAVLQMRSDNLASKDLAWRELQQARLAKRIILAALDVEND